MKKHTKIYMEHFGYGLQDFIPSEISGQRAVDIHHIDARGMGGSGKDDISNLMALTRLEHHLLGDKKEWIEYLKTIHSVFMVSRIPWLVDFPQDEISILLRNYLNK